jgi:hypothetical protein
MRALPVTSLKSGVWAVWRMPYATEWANSMQGDELERAMLEPKAR